MREICTRLTPAFSARVSSDSPVLVIHVLRGFIPANVR
jgi:hypothetical protein